MIKMDCKLLLVVCFVLGMGVEVEVLYQKVFVVYLCLGDDDGLCSLLMEGKVMLVFVVVDGGYLVDL